VAEHLGAAERVFVVPDGSLNLVSLAALPAAGDRYLIERGPVLSYASAERDLVPVGGLRSGGKGLLAVGAPDYDRATRVAGKTDTAGGTQANRMRSDSTDGCGDLAGLDFERLPATETETETAEVVELWRSTVPEGETALYLTGAEASESAFKSSAPGRRVLHLATHGFFLGSDCAASTESTRGVAGIAPSAASAAPPEPTGTATQSVTSPLLLSGLALAGANRRAELNESEDGILTAEEIASLDLTGVELAVLSACDTGVGKVHSGEGVYGLRRAMQVAGVGTQVISLWAVDDESTRTWMESFYDGLLRRQLDVAQAARAAGLAVLETRRDAGESAHPFYWAAFVATGGATR
jgi:CHAT domain-containing protein